MMKNFAEIVKTSKNLKENLIDKVSLSTGLSKEKVSNLYENFSIACNGDMTKINESFVDFIKPEVSFDFEKFSNQITELSKRIVEPGLSPDDRWNITNNMIGIIRDVFEMTPDVPVLLEAVSYVLLNKGNNFKKVAKAISFGEKFKHLFESENIDFKPINVCAENSSEINQLNCKEDVRLYESLREILGKNNKRWGYNYHLDNAYQAILDYLTTEIEELTNKDNTYAVDDTFEMQIIDMLVKQNQLDPMYKHIDVLRKVIPDIQTLVFDMMVLVHNYIETNRWTIQFVNRDCFNQYLSSSEMLFKNISTSRISSKILRQNNSLAPVQEPDSNKTTKSDYDQIFDNFILDETKVDIFTYPLRATTASDCLQIIKCCETEFNLNIRKIINLYFTKAMNLVASTEHVLLEQKETNKFKNSY